MSPFDLADVGRDADDATVVVDGRVDTTVKSRASPVHYLPVLKMGYAPVDLSGYREASCR